LDGRASSSSTNHFSSLVWVIGSTLAPPRLYLMNVLPRMAPLENTSRALLRISASVTSWVGGSSRMTSRIESRVRLRPLRIAGATLKGIVMAASAAVSPMRWAYQSNMLSATRGEKKAVMGAFGTTLAGLGVSLTALVNASESTGLSLSSSQYL